MTKISQVRFAKDQHYISQCILKHFANGKFIYSLDLKYQSNPPRRTSISNICFREDLYTFENMEMTLFFANLFCPSHIEDIKVRKNFLDHTMEQLFENNQNYQNILNTIEHGRNLSIKQLHYLLEVACVLFLRSPSHLEKLFTEEQMMKQIEKYTMPFALIDINLYILLKDLLIVYYKNNPRDFYRILLLDDITGKEIINVFINYIQKYVFWVYETTLDYPFIIGENHHIFKVKGSNYHIFPLSSKYCLVIDIGYYDNIFLKKQEKPYIKEKATKKQVDDINKCLINHNQNYKIFSSNQDILKISRKFIK